MYELKQKRKNLNNKNIPLAKLVYIFIINTLVFNYYKIGTSNQEYINFIIISTIFILVAWIFKVYTFVPREYISEIEKLVNLDELTGVYNNRHFQSELTRALEESDRTNCEVGLIFIDVDYFKNYNDTYGHQAGDNVLKEIGKILKEISKEDYVVARYGGEEFTVILKNTSEEELIEFSENIRIKIKDSYFYGQENQPNENITVSIGVSSYPTRAKSKYELINTADYALYKAKSLNRNRVEVYCNKGEEGELSERIENNVLYN